MAYACTSPIRTLGLLESPKKFVFFLKFILDSRTTMVYNVL